MNSTLFRSFLDKYITDTITIDEKKQLAAMISQPEYEQELASILIDELQAHAYEGEEDPAIRASIQAHISQRITSDSEVPAFGGARVYEIPPRRQSFTLPRVAVAAAVLLVIATTAWLIFSGHTEKNIVKTNNPAPIQTEILPGTEKAILTLADGSRIALDTTRNGAITLQGNTSLIKAGDGQLAYVPVKGGKAPSVGLSYNTLSVPVGGQYRLTLPDGTSVWLNAASSIHYPTAFSGPDRSVDVRGEAYFEVANNKEMPFHVRVNGMDITVLGTSFNINAYENEQSVKTTLLQGAVRVTTTGTTRILQPGEQAIVESTAGNIKVTATDPSLAVAWKNGIFEFQKAGIETIMRQLQRWYGIEVAYESRPSETFGASIQRKEPLDRVLHLLETTGHVHFTIEGRKVTVTQ